MNGNGNYYNPIFATITHAAVIVTTLVCATILGLHGDLNSGDELAVFTAAITGTAAVAASRGGRRSDGQ